MEYIFTELLKNAMRATVEHSRKIGRSKDPPIEIDITQGESEVTIRIRDYGGGIPSHGKNS
jgi:signal transduction histidine kinase